MDQNSDVITYVPWGPISIWGPTETIAKDINSGFQACEEDLEFLLDQYKKNIRKDIKKSDIISLRCGIRPLAVKRNFHRNCYPLELSRKSLFVPCRDKPWISTYGGKLTGCELLAKDVSKHIGKYIPVKHPRENLFEEKIINRRLLSFPGLKEKVPDVEYCRKHEFCVTLEDYLRRRTNISQWVPKGGFGWNNENRDHLLKIALDLSENDSGKARKMVNTYQEKVDREFTRLIENL
jgi:glycerol-3-phosphate dehydrogenase